MQESASQYATSLSHEYHITVTKFAYKYISLHEASIGECRPTVGIRLVEYIGEVLDGTPLLGLSWRPTG